MEQLPIDEFRFLLWGILALLSILGTFAMMFIRMILKTKDRVDNHDVRLAVHQNDIETLKQNI